MSLSMKPQPQFYTLQCAKVSATHSTDRCICESMCLCYLISTAYVGIAFECPYELNQGILPDDSCLISGCVEVLYTE